MTETKILETRINKAPTQPKKVENNTSLSDKIKKVELITLQGITTSQINQALKADNPYPARVFLKPTKRFCQYCEEVWKNQSKCGRQDCGYYDRNCDYLEKDIPVFFRIKEKKYQVIPCPECNFPKTGSWEKRTNCQTKQVAHQSEEVWIRPKIKTGSYLQVQGHFDNPTNKNQRKSFTAYSYQLLNSQPATEKLNQIEQNIK